MFALLTTAGVSAHTEKLTDINGKYSFHSNTLT
uniref:32 amino acids n=1 Tax=Salicornia europaea TaxID=206448 RepID=A0A0P0UWQ8_SALEU